MHSLIGQKTMKHTGIARRGDAMVVPLAPDFSLLTVQGARRAP